MPQGGDLPWKIHATRACFCKLQVFKKFYLGCYVYEKVLLCGPSRLDLRSLEVGRPREFENLKGPHTRTFLYVKTHHFFLVFEMTNQKTGTSEI